MSSKNYFDKQKSKQTARGATKTTVANLVDDVESKKYIQEYERSKEEFIPDVDLSLIHI